MAITFECRECGAGFMANDEMAGSRISCSHCGSSVLIGEEPRPQAPSKRRRMNLLGVLGICTALIGVFTSPYVCATGAVISLLGLSRPRRVTAVIGLVAGVAAAAWHIYPGSANREGIGRPTEQQAVSPRVDHEILGEPRQLITFREDFDGVNEGALPDGWSGSSMVAVRRYRGLSWLHNSGEETVSAQTPPLSLYGDFELEIGVWNENPLRITLVSDAGSEHDVDVIWNGARVSVNEITRSAGAADAWPRRLRLVRRERVLKAILGENECGSAGVPDDRGFRRIRFHLQGGDAFTALESVVVRERDQPVVGAETERFVETFLETADGGIPEGWEAADCVGAMGTSLRASAEGLYRVSTPPIVMSDSFELAVNAGLEETGMFAVIFEGSGTSPDLVLRMTRRRYGRTTVSWTGAADVESDDERSLLQIRIVRNDETWRIALDNLEGNLFAHRIPGEWTFRRISFLLTGGDEGSRLRGVWLGPIGRVVPRRAAHELAPRPLNVADAPAREVEREPADAAEHALPAADDLSGVWLGESGSLRFDDQGRRIVVSLGESDVYSAVDGVLIRNGDEVTAERWLVTFLSDRAQRPRRVAMKATIVDGGHLRYETEAVEYVVRRGREYEVSRKVVTGDLRRSGL